MNLLPNKVTLISAVTPDMGIGFNGQLVYRLKEDMDFFRENTAGHIVVMGRATFNEIRKALPNRINIVLSSQPPVDVVEGILYATTMEEVFDIARQYPEKDLFFIGGQAIYESALSYADEILLTTISGDGTGTALDQIPMVDRFFPSFGHLYYTKTNIKTITVDNLVLSFDRYTIENRYANGGW